MVKRYWNSSLGKFPEFYDSLILKIDSQKCYAAVFIGSKDWFLRKVRHCRKFSVTFLVRGQSSRLFTRATLNGPHNSTHRRHREWRAQSKKSIPFHTLPIDDKGRAPHSHCSCLRLRFFMSAYPSTAAGQSRFGLGPPRRRKWCWKLIQRWSSPCMKREFFVCVIEFICTFCTFHNIKEWIWYQL